MPQLLSSRLPELGLKLGLRLALELELGLGLALGLRLGLVVGPELDSGSGWGWGQRWGRELELEVGLGLGPELGSGPRLELGLRVKLNLKRLGITLKAFSQHPLGNPSKRLANTRRKVPPEWYATCVEPLSAPFPRHAQGKPVHNFLPIVC